MGAFDDLIPQNKRTNAFADLVPAAPAEQLPPQVQTNWLGEALRQAGLSARIGLEGVGDTLDFMASPIRGGLNALGANIQGRTGEAVADLFLPKPETPTEKLVNAAGSSMAGAMVPMAAAQKVAPMVSGATRQVMELLASNPKAQALLSALSGGSAEAVKQQGGGDLAQAGAAIGVPMAAAVAQPTIAGAMRTAKNILTAPTESGARQAAGRIAVDVAGDRAPAIIQAVKQGEAPETFGQAAMRAGSAKMAGLEHTVASRMPDEYGPQGSIARGAEAWRKGQLDNLNAAEDVVRTQLLSQADNAGLDVAGLSMKVAQLKASPGFKDTTSTKVLEWLDKEIVRRSEKGTAGIAGIDLVDLRRDLGKQIQAKAADPKKPWDKAKASKVMREFQKDIDMEIESAVGNDRWTQELMGPSAEFRGNLDAVRQRAKDAKTMGAAGAAEAQRISRLDEQPLTLPNLLSRPMMVANAALRFFQGKGGERTSRTLAQLMQPHEKMGLVRLMDEELKRRAARTPMSQLVKRAGVAGAMESEQITSE